MCRVSLDFSPAVNDQVIKRIDRAAKRIARGVSRAKPIRIIDCKCSHRVDEIVWNTLGQKQMVLDDIGLKSDVAKANRRRGFRGR